MVVTAMINDDGDMVRMVTTSQALPDGTTATWEKLKALISTQSSYKQMRDLHSSGNPPILPYLGLYHLRHRVTS